MSAASLKKFIKSPLGLVIVCIFLIIFFYFIFKSDVKRAFMTFGNYKETNGVISKVDKSYKGFVISYEYDVKDINYKNDQRVLLPFFPRFSVREKIVVKYDESNPTISIIKSTEWQMYASIIIILLGTPLVIRSVYKRKQQG